MISAHLKVWLRVTVCSEVGDVRLCSGPCQAAYSFHTAHCEAWKCTWFCMIPESPFHSLFSSTWTKQFRNHPAVIQLFKTYFSFKSTNFRLDCAHSCWNLSVGWAVLLYTHSDTKWSSEFALLWCWDTCRACSKWTKISHNSIKSIDHFMDFISW